MLTYIIDRIYQISIHSNKFISQRHFLALRLYFPYFLIVNFYYTLQISLFLLPYILLYLYCIPYLIHLFRTFICRIHPPNIKIIDPMSNLCNSYKEQNNFICTHYRKNIFLNHVNVPKMKCENLYIVICGIHRYTSLFTVKTLLVK